MIKTLVSFTFKDLAHFHNEFFVYPANFYHIN